MTEAGSAPEVVAASVVRASDSTGLLDGEWHRLHPATPLLRGGFALIAVAGVLISNFRERVASLLLGTRQYEGDPVDYVIDNGLLPLALLLALGVVAIFVAGFALSWRFHSFRITPDAVQVRSGVLFRTSRTARLDRIQGIAISAPLFARLFGASRLEISQAGHDANVHLAYLGTRAADALRRDILRAASGIKAEERATAELSAHGAIASATTEQAQSLIERRVHELLAPERDPALAPPESVVRLHPLRLFVSVLLSESMLVFLVYLGGLLAITLSTGEPFALVGLVPGLLGLGGVLLSRFTRSLRYSVAGTPDGIRVGFGLLSTSNDTLPPGRIHSLAVRQSPLWRPFGWWSVRVTVASHTQRREQQQRSILLPVGTVDEALRVLQLALPGIGQDDTLRRGIVGRGGDEFTVSPPRARVLRWFSRRRNGVALLPDAVLLRRGAVWRELVLVPAPRMQSVAMTQGPLLRGLDLAALHLHTVSGPISAHVGALDRRDVQRLFGEIGKVAVSAGSRDTTHRWRTGEVPAP